MAACCRVYDSRYRLTAKNQDQLWNPTLGSRVWATFLYIILLSNMLSYSMCWGITPVTYNLSTNAIPAFGAMRNKLFVTYIYCIINCSLYVHEVIKLYSIDRTDSVYTLLMFSLFFFYVCIRVVVCLLQFHHCWCYFDIVCCCCLPINYVC